MDNVFSKDDCDRLHLIPNPVSHMLKCDRCFNYRRYLLPEYKVWVGIRTRCLSPKDKQYHNYGGRGITVCDRWKNSFRNFLEDMGARPLGTHEPSLRRIYSIERIDNNGNYEPSNCRWATYKEQSRNRRNNVFIDFRGEKLTIVGLSEISGISQAVISHRLSKGLKGEDLIQPAYEPVKYQYRGRKLTIPELAELSGMVLETLYARVKKFNYDIEKALHEPYIPQEKDSSKFVHNQTVEIEGELFTIKELSEKFEMNLNTLLWRFKSGKRGYDLVKPAFRNRLFYYKGKNYNTGILSKVTGLNAPALNYWLVKKGMTVEELLTKFPNSDISLFNLPDDDLSTMWRNLPRYKYKDTYYTLEELSKITGVKRNTISHRILNCKMTVEEAVSKPTKYQKINRSSEESDISKNIKEKLIKEGYVVPLIYNPIKKDALKVEDLDSFNEFMENNTFD